MHIENVGRLMSRFFRYVLIMSQSKFVWASEKFLIEIDPEILKKDSVNYVGLDKVISDGDSININELNYRLKAESIVADGELFHVLVLNKELEASNLDDRVYCLESIINTINEGVILSDKNHKITLYNPAQEGMEKKEAKEILGKYMWEAFNYEDKDRSEHKHVFDTKRPIINKYRAHTFENSIPQFTSYSTHPIIKDDKTLGVFTIAKNETMLRNLLYETIELKRKIFDNENKENKPLRINGTSFTFSDIIGNSESMQKLIQETQSIATLESSIIIVGETGTGKEMLAQSIHNFGREKEPFIAINCAAIPENLLESILFGTVKGSYTGAVDRKGLFEEAGNGTLFLDEINSMSMGMQAKLLRVLQERRVRRVGSADISIVNCRIICATNEEPQKLIQEEKLRVDLFYRVAGFYLYIPPLRDRKEDILTFCYYFINKYNKLLYKNVKNINSRLTNLILHYDWPGNVRELEHVMYNLMVKIDKNKTDLTDKEIPDYLREMIFRDMNKVSIAEKKGQSLPELLRDVEKTSILKALNDNQWNLTKTAKSLGIIRQSLNYRMKKLDITKE